MKPTVNLFRTDSGQAWSEVRNQVDCQMSRQIWDKLRDETWNRLQRHIKRHMKNKEQ